MSTQPQVPFTAIFGGSFLAIIALAIGLVMSIISGSELITSLRCGEQPAATTVAELANRGPKSGWLTLRDYEIQWDGYIYWADEQGQWTTCDVPLRAAGSQAPPRVLLRVGQVRSDAELRQVLAREELTGVVTGRGLHGEYGAPLAANNPGIDPAACWIVMLDKRPVNPLLLGGLFAAGLALFTSANFLLVYVRQPSSPAQASLRVMSPLIMVVDGLHMLSDRLPRGSRWVCGLVLLPAMIGLSSWSGLRLWQILQGTAGESPFGAELLPIVGLNFGISFALIAVSFLLVDWKGPGNCDPLTSGANSLAHASAGPLPRL